MASKLRAGQLFGSFKPGITEQELLKQLSVSLKKRRALAFGQIDIGKSHCAMGCFFADNDNVAVPNALIDQVAAVNDAVPDELGNKVRMQIVRNWVSNRAKALGVTL